MDKLKYVKLEQEDGSYSEAIPIVADSDQIDINDETLTNRLNKTPYYYNTVASMKADTKLKNGDMAITLGYYTENDGGGAEYKIVNENSSGVWNESLNNALYARLIIKNDELNILQIGLVEGDPTKSTQNTTFLNSVVNKVRRTIVPQGNFYLNDAIVINTYNRNLVGTAINNCNLIYNGNANNSMIKIGHNMNLISGITIRRITFGVTEHSGITNNINAIEFVGKSPTHNIIEQCVFRSFKTAILAGKQGHVNNITIRDNNIYTCYNGIDFQYYNGYQINAIYIYGNDISQCENCGIIMFGNNMVIENNTIQACKNYGISVGEDETNNFTQYCINSVINNNYFELNGSISQDAVILLTCGTANGSNYYKNITGLSIMNNYFTESISKINVVSTGYHGITRISAMNNTTFTIKNANLLTPGSIILSPGEQPDYPYTIEKSNSYAFQSSNEYFYNVLNKNYYATNRPIGVDADKQTTIIIYPTQVATSTIANDIKLAIVKMNIVGTLGTNYWASNFNFETKSHGNTIPNGSFNYDNATGINTPIISPLFYTFYSNKPTTASLGYVYVLKIQGNGQASEFNVYIDMVCNWLTARGYKVKINENENQDVVSIVPTDAPSADKDKLVYCTADSKWYGYWNNGWHDMSI